MKRLLLTTLFSALAGCGGPSYTPRPDAEIFRAVSAVPGVVAADLRSHEGGAEGTGYEGDVTVKDGADPATVIDAVLALLWQGLPDAGYTGVAFYVDGRALRAADAGLLTHQDLEARYGEQPGTGVPPKDKPALQVRD